MVKKWFNGLRAVRALLKDGYLVERGWFRSFSLRTPEDAAGAPIPWICYPAIEFIASRLRPEMTVFEYGSGNSTRWWAARTAQVDSFEHDSDWFGQVDKTLPDNARLFLRPDDGYFQPELGRTYDVVMVDGWVRNEDRH